MHKKHFAIFLGALLIFALFSSSAFLQGALQDASAAVGIYIQNHSLLGPILFMLLAAGSVALGPFSSTPLVPLTIPTWGTGLTFTFLFAGWLIGNTAAYFLGRYIGYPLAKAVIPAGRFNRWIDIFSNKVDFPIAFLFRIATPSETGYIFGMVKFNFLKYMVITITAEIPFAIITVYAGEAFLRAGWISFTLLGLAWIAIIYWSFQHLNSKLKSRAQQQ